MKIRAIFTLLVILLGCLGLAFTGFSFKQIVNSRIERAEEDIIYQNDLGIDATEREVLGYMNANMVGKHYEEVLKILEDWGEIKSTSCSVGNPHRCEVLVEQFLGTDNVYEFVLFIEDGYFTSVTIEHSEKLTQGIA